MGQPAVRSAVLMVLVLLGAGCDANKCDDVDCEACTREECEALCEAPDRGPAYACLWECRDGSRCTLGCEPSVTCNLACSASACSCEDCDALCTDGAECHVVDPFDGKVGCEGSTCELDCGSASDKWWDCQQACWSGSSCTMACGAPSEEATPLDEGPRCRMACDESSSCRLRCIGDARCSICCGGSSDCAIDCSSGGATCDGGILVCGETTCEEAAESCPMYSAKWLGF